MSVELPQKIDLEDEWLTVHLAGPGIGEGILITIGQKIAIGIDSCSTLIEAKEKGGLTYLEQQIAGLADDSYLLWLISHFHGDHFQSFDTIVDLFEDKLASIMVPSDYTQRDLVANAVYADTKATMKKGTLADVAKTQYEKIRTALGRESLENKIEWRVGQSTWIKTSLRLLDRKREIPLHVEIYAPTYQNVRKLQGKAVKGLAKGHTSAALANEGSYVLHIRAGQFEGLFLGDVPSQKTVEILKTIKPNDASVIYLKVSHHGSLTGTSELLLEKLSETTNRSSNRYALIAPFDVNGLPVDRVKEMLKNANFNIREANSWSSTSSIIDGMARQCAPLMNTTIDKAIAVSGDIIVERIHLNPHPDRG